MGEALLLRVKNQLAELDRMSHVVHDLAARHALPERTGFEVTLALDEVLTNVISYAYDDDAEHEILVHVSLNDCELRVQVEDDGQPFDPLGLPPPDLDLGIDDRPIGGLGVHLVRCVMDGLEYRRESGRNILVMIKRLPPPVAAW